MGDTVLRLPLDFFAKRYDHDMIVPSSTRCYMANPIVVGDYALVTFYCTLWNQVAMNRRYYACTAKFGSGSDDVAFAAQLSAIFGPAYCAIMSQKATFKGVSCQ